MSAHTPGPWKVSKDAMGPNVLGQIGGEWITVADQLEEGDARLIAAAPRMLRELRIMVQRYEALCALTKTTGSIANTREARAILRDVEDK